MRRIIVNIDDAVYERLKAMAIGSVIMRDEGSLPDALVRVVVGGVENGMDEINISAGPALVCPEAKMDYATR